MTRPLELRKNLIEKAFSGEAALTDVEISDAIESVILDLDQGRLRVCSRENGTWVVHEWIKKAILLYFRLKKMAVSEAGDLQFCDKIPTKQMKPEWGVRVVPPGVARYGAYLETGVILMPGYVNIGAYVGEGTMVDTWATVGSCAQIGKHVHLSGGVGIGGVLEPIQASPVIIEDHVFVGSRCIVVEGVHVEEGAVLGAGVVLTASTKILDVRGKEVQVLKGRVPKNAVVIPGSVEKDFPAGKFGVPCALIIGERSAQTDKKTSLTSALRDFGVSV